MNLRQFTAVLLGICTSATVFAAASEADRAFVAKASADGAAEVEMGRTAASKASNPKVQEFGQRMVTDHSKSGDQLKKIAEGLKIPLAQGPNAEQKAAHDKLRKLSGADFDAEYMRLMHQDHDKAVNLFRKQAESGQEAALKKFARETLPVLAEHQQMARALAATTEAKAK